MSILEVLSSVSNNNKVCNLRKSLSGLKQSPSEWYAKMYDFLITKLSFKSSQNDSRLYVRQTGPNTIIIALYVEKCLPTMNTRNSFSDYLFEKLKRNYLYNVFRYGLVTLCYKIA